MNKITRFFGNAVSALLDGKVHVLLHCCNPYNAFGAGIAREIRERIPAAYDADTAFYTAANGNAEAIKGSFSTGANVYNCYGQNDVPLGRDRRQVHYGHLVNALACASVDIRERIDSGDLPADAIICFPYKFASDLAGGDWEVVLELIEGVFFDLNVHIYQLT